MAIGREAVEAIAGVTGFPVPTVTFAARVLREHDAELWPEGKRGGGVDNPHVTADHLVNVVLALAVADPLVKAASALTEYRDMAWLCGEADGQFPLTRRMVVGCDFADTLAILVEALSAPTAGEVADVRVVVGRDPMHAPFGEIHLLGPFPPHGDPAIARLGFYINRPNRAHALDAVKATPGRFTQSTTIPGPLFATLAELVADSRDVTTHARAFAERIRRIDAATK